MALECHGPKTRYILASHLTPIRGEQAPRLVLRKAALAADGLPKGITIDNMRSYMLTVKDVLPEAKHIQSEEIRASNNNLSERLQGIFRLRIKTGNATRTAGRWPTTISGAMRVLGTRRRGQKPR